MNGEDQMRMELQRMQRRADEVTDQSLESTRRMLQMAEETQDMGIKTLVELDAQGEKVDRVEENLDTINADIKKAEMNLTGLDKCCGLFSCPCWKVATLEITEQYRKATRDDGKTNVRQSKPAKPSQGAVSTGGYIKRVTNDAREDEMDEHLGEVAGIVDNLKSMALDIGGELEKQNVQIDRISGKVTVNEARLEHANRQAERVLRN